MPTRDVHIQKINHGPSPNPVHDVAQGSAHEQAVAKRLAPVSDASIQKKAETDGNSGPQDNEEPALPAARVGQKAECGSGIEDMHDIEKRRQCYRLPQIKGSRDGVLGRLISDHCRQCYPKILAAGVGDFSD